MSQMGRESRLLADFLYGISLLKGLEFDHQSCPFIARESPHHWDWRVQRGSPANTSHYSQKTREGLVYTA